MSMNCYDWEMHSKPCTGIDKISVALKNPSISIKDLLRQGRRASPIHANDFLPSYCAVLRMKYALQNGNSSSRRYKVNLSFVPLATT